MLKILRIVFVAALSLLFAIPVFSADFSYKGKVEPTSVTSRLFKFYIEKFDPESAELIIEEEPDGNALFRNIYMDIVGCNVSGVRIDRLTFQLIDAQFNSPEEWESGDVDCVSSLEAYATCRLLEDDVNADLQHRVIGDGDDSWRNLKLRISPNGISGSGIYSVTLLFTFEILIEIESKLRIVGGQEVWLEDTTLRLNRLDVPEYITNMALDQIQPILDLKTVTLPLRLNKIIFKEKEAFFETRTHPSRFEGITYTYVK
ncbi:MAG: DUF2993 domain-containing protein [Synergistaceae bacterium]|nr:DUF2993 domain-containing protein [Synergistaceae bacterium]